jgi:folate-binding protein YgfZ
MTNDWQTFLQTQAASLQSHDDGDDFLYPIDYLSVLKVSGAEATIFLQGQLTCDVAALNDCNSFFAGLCNAKGRVISTLLILKRGDDFLLIVPTQLIEKIQQILARYLLRAKVQLQVANDEFCLSGLSSSSARVTQLAWTTKDFSQQNQLVKLPLERYLLIDSASASIQRWTDYWQLGFQLGSEIDWQVMDFTAKMAWLNLSSSEVYIPQMLNLDQLGGISFTKGCYIGQEVVARTHYLGTTKRQLFLLQAAEYQGETGEIIEASGQVVGQILSRNLTTPAPLFLAVLQIQAVSAGELYLNNAAQTPVQILG